MPQVVDLADRLAAQDTIVAYANSLDDRDFDSYRRLFRPDVILEGFGPKTIRGVDAWLEFVEKALAPYRQTQHMLGPQLATIDGDDADARTDLQAIHMMKEPAGEIFTLWGTYQTRFRRGADGTWRIARHELVVRATDNQPGT